MGSDMPYNERRLLWKAVRLVFAVTCVRTAPRPVGANCVQAQPAGPVRFYAAPRQYGGRGRIESAFMPRLASTAGGGGFLWAVIRPIMSGGFYGKRYALCKL